MLALALLVLPVVLVEESHAPAPLRSAAAVANWLIWLVFAAELLFVVAVAPRKRRALRAHRLELAIVVLTPPFLPRVFSFLRAARMLRLLRLFRLGMFGARALRAERVLASREGFPYVALATIVLVVVSGAAVSEVDTKEFPNVWRGIWWAVVTVTTVGYGDYAPTTTGGRVLGTLLMIVGIGFISLLTATIASSFITRGREREELLTPSERAAARGARRALATSRSRPAPASPASLSRSSSLINVSMPQAWRHGQVTFREVGGVRLVGGQELVASRHGAPHLSFEDSRRK